MTVARSPRPCCCGRRGRCSPAWIWLERWARPWIIAALVGLSLAIVLPGLSHDEAATVSATPTLTSDLTGASTGTTFVLAETVGN
jgi:hypothetical protein